MGETSYVVTGGGRGIGRALVEHLLAREGHVVTIELHPRTLHWVDDHPARERIHTVIGDAGDESVADLAAQRAQAQAPLVGWVNNAAQFQDATLHSSDVATIMELIARHLTA